MNRSRLPYLLAVVWLSTVALAFFAGRGSAPVIMPPPDDGGGAASTRFATEGASRSVAPGGGWDGSSDTRITVSSGPRGGKSATAPAGFKPASLDAETAIRVLSDPDPLRRMVGLTEILQGITPENAKEMLAAFRDNPGGDMMGRMQDFGMFLEAWARVDGPAAIEWVVNSGEFAAMSSFGGGGRGGMGGRDRGGIGGDWASHMASYRVLSSWSSADPAAAKAWAVSKGEEGKENPYLLGVIRGIARTDLASATALTETMPYGRLRGMAADGLIETALQQGPEASLGWARSLQDTQLRDGITARLADRLARTDPMLAISAVSDIQDPERKKETLTDVAASWARRDPAEAMNWVSRMDDPATKAAAQASVVSSWARRDAAATAAWLGAQPRGEPLDASITAFVHRTAGSNPQQALLTANAITNEQTRRATLERIMSQWMEADPEAAKKFMEKAP